MWLRLFLALGTLIALVGNLSAQDFFQTGLTEYESGHFEKAADLFGKAAAHSPGPGSLYNLGNADWRAGRPGPAVLAWEQAQWLDPFVRNATANLRFARRSLQLDAPDLSWYEICSTWLPVDAWPCLACVTFWLALAMVLLPGMFRWRRAGWQQGLAAASFAVFLLTLPALVGVHTRTRLGVVISAETPLRLTPTSEAQALTRLPAGTVGRVEARHGIYVLVRCGAYRGWLEAAQLGLIARLQSPA
jgi:tetratricopeptide (TPR) repeat protein